MFQVLLGCRLGGLAWAALTLACLPVQAGEPTNEISLEGSFAWDQRDGGKVTGELQAVFTPAGENSWAVAFHFDWEGEAQVYAGTAEGSLTDGALDGIVHSGDKFDSTYEFHGRVTDGTFRGTHGFVSDGELKEGGTLTLKPQLRSALDSRAIGHGHDRADHRFDS